MAGTGGLPAVTGKDALRALMKDGWEVVRVAGSHHHLHHPTKPGLVTVPVHAGKTLPPGTLKRILGSAGLTTDEFKGLL
jgi:predicted RNA binding protein YcfA (HicA-like mRNA interferase family)